jgi:hypothetical protein
MNVRCSNLAHGGLDASCRATAGARHSPENHWLQSVIVYSSIRLI